MYSNPYGVRFSNEQAPIMKEFIKELNPFSIAHFAYNRIIGNNRFMALCPHHQWFREQVGHELDDELISNPLHIIHENKNIGLWSLMSGSTVASMFKEKNINHGITIIRTLGVDQHEAFHFASTNENPGILNFYINNIDFLNEFINYFLCIMGSKIEDHLYKKLIGVPMSPSLSKKLSSHRNLAPSLRYNLLEQNNTITIMDEKKPLTKMQYLCFQMLKRGLSSKEIARILQRSPRTVEEHIAEIYKKLDIHSRKELMNFS